MLGPHSLQTPWGPSSFPSIPEAGQLHLEPECWGHLSFQSFPLALEGMDHPPTCRPTCVPQGRHAPAGRVLLCLLHTWQDPPFFYEGSAPPRDLGVRGEGVCPP